MPNCFNLIDRATNEPAILQHIDDKLRLEFKQPPDPDHWLAGWYHAIGFRLACGKDFTSIRQEFKALADKPEDAQAKDWYESILCIIDYLDVHYTSNAWVSRSI